MKYATKPAFIDTIASIVLTSLTSLGFSPISALEQLDEKNRIKVLCTIGHDLADEDKKYISESLHLPAPSDTASVVKYVLSPQSKAILAALAKDSRYTESLRNRDTITYRPEVEVSDEDDVHNDHPKKRARRQPIPSENDHDTTYHPPKDRSAKP